MSQIVYIDTKRMWKQILPGWQHLNLTTDMSDKRLRKVRRGDVLIIHTADGLWSDREYLLSFFRKRERGFRIILVTGGSSEKLDPEWREIADTCQANILPYVPHFSSASELSDTQKAKFFQTIIGTNQGCDAYDNAPEVASPTVDSSPPALAVSWIDRARGDLHFMSKVIAAKSALGADRLLRWLNETDRGETRRVRIVDRVLEIQRQWEDSVARDDFHVNAARCKTKASFDREVGRFVSCVRAFKAGADTDKLHEAFGALHDAAVQGLKRL